MSIALALAGLGAAAGTARADAIQVTGAPAAERAAIVASLEKVRTMMGVCWVRKPPATVKVALEVAAGGAVTRATARSKGPSAQCAAGILAVATLAPAAKAWKGTVDVASASPGKGEDVRAIHDQLVAHGPTFFDCQKKAPAFVGKIVLRVTVQRDGTITAATGDVGELTGGAAKDGAAVARCVGAAAKPLALSPIASETVTYELAMSFQGGGASSGSPAATAGSDRALQPSKKGPLANDEIARAINVRRAALVRCAQGKRARGKVVIRVAIAPDGKPTAKIKSSEIDAPAIEGCLVKVFQAMSFRAADGPTVVLYPVRLDADGLKTGT